MSSAAPVTIVDAVNWTKGSYLIYLAPWGAGSLVRGTDYWDSATFDASLFPNNVTMTWRWPETVAPAGVYNMNMIDFGNGNNAVVQSPITPLQVKNIGTLSQTHSFTLGGDPAKYDVITDFWLTQKPNDFTHKLFEVEVALHTPAYGKAYFLSATPVGTYTDAQGRAWTVTLDKHAANAPDILIMPQGGADLTAGTVDFKGMLDWLTAHGVITGNEYFNGLAMGPEVRQGSGSLTISDFHIDYSAGTSATQAQTLVTTSAHDVFRFYDTVTGDHFYTTSTTERDGILKSLPTYQYEGAAFTSADKSATTLDVYRFYDAVSGTHFFTTSTAERDSILKNLPSYHYEGVVFEAYADASSTGTLTLERFYNASTGQHHYATPEEAVNMLAGSAGAGWVDEGKAFAVHGPMGIVG